VLRDYFYRYIILLRQYDDNNNNLYQFKFKPLRRVHILYNHSEVLKLCRLEHFIVRYKYVQLLLLLYVASNWLLHRIFYI